MPRTPTVVSTASASHCPLYHSGAAELELLPATRLGRLSQSRLNSLSMYSGSMRDGRWHGRGTLYDAENQVRFEGRFRNGCKHGRGTMFFEGGASLSGVWHADELQGAGVYTFPSGASLEGHWVDGVIMGHVREFAPDRTLLFEGEYDNDVRHGQGRLLLEGGGMLCGRWLEGEFDGSSNTFFYPNGAGCLRGVWCDGDMKCSRYIPLKDLARTAEVAVHHKCARASGNSDATCYHLETPSKHEIASRPLQPDPYEVERVYVAPSTLQGAGEGLFAKCDLQASEVCSFYNGIRIPHEEMDARAWSQNSNAISLDDEFAIDVPPPWDSVDHYVATLAHKANHSFHQQNAHYDLFVHPRFGPIKCIRVNRAVQCGEEIFVDYGYDERDRPDWYQKSWAETKNNDDTLR